jgi:hypothetical protein
MQKRYKEIYAPGSKLDIRAVDKNGELFAKNPNSRCIYFEDIAINVEQDHPELAETLALVFGKDVLGSKADTMSKE